jgi:hypothetical protein
VTQRAAAVATAIALAVAVVACDEAPAGTPSTTAAGASTTTCSDCRTLGVGHDAQLGAASVGVRHCDAAACALSTRSGDGGVTRATVRRGDTFSADGTWSVVRVDGTGLVVRPG